MRRTPTLAVTVCALAALTACSAEAVSSATPANPGESQLAPSTVPATAIATGADYRSKLPKRVRDSRTMIVATNPSYVPVTFPSKNPNKPQGLDVDLMNEIGKRLGIEVVWKQPAFDKIVPGVAGTKYDAGASGLIVRNDRVQQVAMVTYYSAGIQWATKKKNPRGVNVRKPCGRTVGVQVNTYEHTDELPRINAAECADKPIKVVTFPTQDGPFIALKKGQVDAVIADSPVTGYYVKTSGKTLELKRAVTSAALYGIVVSKDDEAFANVLADVLTEMAADGTYAQILERWGAGHGAVSLFDVIR